MSEQRPYFRLERRVSPYYRATLALKILEAMREVPNAIGHIEARKPKTFNVNSMTATEFRRVVHSRQPDATIKKLPYQTWEIALSSRIAKFSGNSDPLRNVFVGSVMLLGADKDQVVLTLHSPQLEAERSQTVAIGSELGGITLEQSRVHVSLGSIDKECDPGFLEALRMLVPHTLDLEPRQPRAVSSDIIDQRVKERAFAKYTAA